MEKKLVFTIGDEVEVSSDDDGFKGSWFEAKIVRYMPKQLRYTVVYDSLMSDEDDSKPLRETVDASHVRPRPPRHAHSDRRFDLNQAVDAFHNDGWWAGVVISRLHGVSRYTVRFSYTGDEIEYEPSDLRVHLDWIDGEWVVPKDQTTLEMEFRKGMVVEVSSDDDGFRGAWFAATVIKSVGKKFIVEYQNLTTNDGTKPLRETVDAQHIRPTPPDIPVVKNFKRLEEVDVFYNDGWWVGVISKLLKGRRYMVYFRPSKEEMVFGHKRLRLHHDWIDGKWVQASQLIIEHDFKFLTMLEDACHLTKGIAVLSLYGAGLLFAICV